MPRPAAPRLHSVKALLEQRTPIFTESSAQQASQDAWRARLEKILPDSMAAHVSGILERQGGLIVYAESAAWGTRLRYAIAECEAALRAGRPELGAITVRVMPRRGH